MTPPTENLTANVIEAAGGLLWRPAPAGRELCLIHRPHYDDWTLPKGKRDPGESWQQTALREVFEETGCRAALSGFAGSVAYTVRGIAKVVLFWHMNLKEDCTFTPNDEVNQLVWLPLEKALRKLSYATERELLEKLT